MDTKSTVGPSLRALLAGTVDYAGLFPPAGLPLEEALENHASYQYTGDAWMLGRFVLPTGKMAAAGAIIVGQFRSEHVLRISALMSKAEDAGAFLPTVIASLQALARFREVHGSSVAVDQLEAPLPATASVATELRALLGQAAETMDAHAPGPLATFWELPFSKDLFAAMTEMASFNATSARPFGVKLRTGGLVARAFPSTVQLADAFVAARECGVALKFTAGLHHPIRRYDAGVQAKMHGFLNVFAAGVLAREHELGAAEICAILDDENPENFRSKDDNFSWRDLSVSTAALTEHRRFITSFGSCSFDEPRDDMRQLGLLPDL